MVAKSGTTRECENKVRLSSHFSTLLFPSVLKGGLYLQRSGGTLNPPAPSGKNDL